VAAAGHHYCAAFRIDQRLYPLRRLPIVLSAWSSAVRTGAVQRSLWWDLRVEQSGN